MKSIDNLQTFLKTRRSQKISKIVNVLLYKRNTLKFFSYICTINGVKL